MRIRPLALRLLLVSTPSAAAASRGAPPRRALAAFVPPAAAMRCGPAEGSVVAAALVASGAVAPSRPAVPPLGRRRGAPAGAARRRMAESSSDAPSGEDGGVNFDSLMDMDVVLFSRRRGGEDGSSDPKMELGALQEDGTLAPLSAWTLESAFSGGSDSIEFLVDEEDRFPGLAADDVIVHSVLDESLIGYGSRQVGGGKGPGNPHGEESELLYYVERKVLEGNVDGADGREVEVVIKPELEILW